MYTAFKRLEQNGLIRSYWGDEGAGARRRYYAVTEEGLLQLKESRLEWEHTRGLLDALVSV